MKYILSILVLFSLSVLATMPAILILLNQSNIAEYGFKVETHTDSTSMGLTLIAPPIISNNWYLVGTQSSSFTGESLGLLAKSSVPKSSESVNVTVYYQKGDSDISVGVYYQCVATSEYGCGPNKQKLFYIESVDDFTVIN